MIVMIVMRVMREVRVLGLRWYLFEDQYGLLLQVR